MCVWSGLDVFYEIKTATVYNTDGSLGQQGQLFKKDRPAQGVENMPYMAIIKDSDYKTYAKIVIGAIYENFID